MSSVQRARLVLALGVLNLVLVATTLAVGGLGGWTTPGSQPATATPETAVVLPTPTSVAGGGLPGGSQASTSPGETGSPGPSESPAGSTEPSLGPTPPPTGSPAPIAIGGSPSPPPTPEPTRGRVPSPPSTVAPPAVPTPTPAVPTPTPAVPTPTPIQATPPPTPRPTPSSTPHPTAAPTPTATPEDDRECAPLANPADHVVKPCPPGLTRNNGRGPGGHGDQGSALIAALPLASLAAFLGGVLRKRRRTP